MSFGRKKKQKEQQQQENPYLSARREYGDRYGAAVNEAARWRQICFFLLMLCVAFGAMMIWMSSQNKVTPYVVQVDKQGYSVAIKPASDASGADTRVVIAALSNFITNFKTVMADIYAQRRMVDEVYNYVASGSPAEGVVTSYYRENSPFDENRRTTLVEIISVLGIGSDGKSWQVLWTEKEVINGTVTSTTEWRAILSIAISPVQDVAQIIKNPLGIYVTELNMAQDIVNN
ncbi:MAG: conjugal transfer protein TrbF [Synergistaceae bacterium]|nr:conjugal transfer protein TrbF [Synergistaceae bacterium]MBR0094031.1 conjugal transfer protein TrbF [Synergistaceae bacterium]